MNTRPDLYKNTFPVSWELLHRDLRALARRIEKRGPFQGIVAIVRGGLIPAGIMARELNLRIVETVCVASYDGQRIGECIVNKSLSEVLPDGGRGWLIVDDLVDTGNTARMVRAQLPEACFVTVYAKPAGKPLVDEFITEVGQDTWVLFPWDDEGAD